MKFSSMGIIGVVFLVVSCVSYVFLKNGASTRNNAHFIVGTAAAYAPFVSINAQGVYEGFDIDVAHALAEQMGKELALKDLGSMTSLFVALDQGSIDAIIWGISITQDRLKKVAMIHYQGEPTTTYPLIFWKTIPASIHTIDDMKDATICVEPTSSQDFVLSKYVFINKLPIEKIDDALLTIQYGKADAAFVEPAIAKKFKNRYPEIQTLDVVLAPEDRVHGIGIVIKNANAELIARVTEAVSVLKATGVIGKLEKVWGIAA